MENQSLLLKIKSKYIIEILSSYINREDFIFELIKHSKSLQKKLEIDLIDYKYKYLEKRINIRNYLYEFNLIKDLSSNSFYKDKYDIKSLLEIILFYFTKKFKQKINSEVFDYNNLIDLDFNNPVFKLILIVNIFDNININIDLEEVKNNNLKSEINSNFQKMNKLNSKYTSLYFEFKDMNDINYIKDFKIEFNKIKRLSFRERYNDNEYNNIDIYFNTLISFDNIMNSLIYLSLIFYSNRKISKDIFKKINEFKSLNYLKLEEIELSDDSFLLKLSNLKSLNLNSCKNINLIDNTNNENNILTKLKNLSISYCFMSKPEILY